MQLFFWGKWNCAIWASAQNCNFSWNQPSNCDQPWQKALSLQLKAPNSVEIYISSCYCGDLLFITSWENTAANGTLVLSLTCTIFLYKECISSVFSSLILRRSRLLEAFVTHSLPSLSDGRSSLVSICETDVTSYDLRCKSSVQWFGFPFGKTNMADDFVF